MMLGFKRRFGPLVWDGSKTHTIRKKGGQVRRAGETCHCFIDARQKSMTLLGRWVCTRIQPAIIYYVGSPPSRRRWRRTAWPKDVALQIVIDGEVLDQYERNTFAWRDGFRPAGSTLGNPGQAWLDFEQYWTSNLHPSDPFPFDGELIHWQYDPAARNPATYPLP